MELHVRVVSARNLLDKQTFGRQDPYCKISVGHRSFKTRVDDNGHRTPYWNERFVFDVHDPNMQQVHILVKDKNFMDSAMIGETHLPVNMFTHGNIVDQWFPLNNYNRYAGEINLRIQVCHGASGGVAYAAATAPVAYSTCQTTYQEPVKTTVYASAPMAVVSAPPPPPVVMAPPPPPPVVVQQQPSAVVMQPAPVMMQPATTTTVVYENNGYCDRNQHHHHYHDSGRSGAGAGTVAMGVGAGLVGGFLLSEAMDD